MTPETETASPSGGSNGGDGSDTTIIHTSEISESKSSNRGRGRSRGGCTRIFGHQGHDRRDGSFNTPEYTSLIRIFKG